MERVRETQNFQSEQNIAEALRLARGVGQHRRLTVRRRRLTGRGYTPGAIRGLSFLKSLSAIGAKRLLASRRPDARVGSDPRGSEKPRRLSGDGAQKDKRHDRPDWA